MIELAKLIQVQHLAGTPQQWEQALPALLAEAGLRQRIGQAGSQKVAREHCVRRTGARMAALLRSASTATRKEM